MKALLYYGGCDVDIIDLPEDAPAERGLEGLPDVGRGRRGQVARLDGRVQARLYVDNRVGLTVRELQLLCLIREGLTNQEIADGLYLSINSVKSYIRTAYRRIGARRRADAIRWGYEHLTPTPPTPPGSSGSPDTPASSDTPVAQAPVRTLRAG